MDKEREDISKDVVEEVRDLLIAISVIAKKLSKKLDDAIKEDK